MVSFSPSGSDAALPAVDGTAQPSPPTTWLHVDMQSQPDDVTCGPTCLHAVYRYFGDPIPLRQVVDEISQLRGGGTLASLLGGHALRRGYKATLFTFDLNTFDPTWLTGDHAAIPDKLRAQMLVKPDPKLHAVSRAYLDFLEQGGTLRFEDLNRPLIRRVLNRRVPIVVGLSSTYLYREIREIPATTREDDVRGCPAGHFVVLHGYEQEGRMICVADPYGDNPLSAAREHRYAVPIDRVICAILLGIVTYDANLLIIEPKTRKKARS